MTQSRETASKIDEHRRLKACGRDAEARAKKDSLQGILYQTKEVLPSVGVKEFNMGKTGRWRLQSQCVLNGLVMCDYDHLDSEELRVKNLLPLTFRRGQRSWEYCWRL